MSAALQAEPDFNQLFGGTIMSATTPPYDVFAQLRRERPVLRMKGWLEDSHLVTRYDDVLAGMRDAETFSARANARGIGIVIGRTILEMEGAEHSRQRRILTPHFALRALRAKLEPFIEATTHELIDEFAKDGRADLVHQFTFTFPMRVIARMIGVPISDFHEFHGWALALVSIADDPVKGFAGAKAIVDYLRPILAQRRDDPRDDLLTVLLTTEVEGEKLDDEELVSFLRLLLPAGAETTYRLIGNVLLALLTHPDARAEVQANRDAPARGDRRDAALGVAGPDHLARVHARRRDRRLPHHEGRPRVLLDRLRQPRREPLRGPGPLRPAPREQGRPALVRPRRALLPRVAPGAHGDAHRGVRAPRPASEPAARSGRELAHGRVRVPLAGPAAGAVRVARPR